ncbi:MAG TPA: DNA N-6-adenine-methyltransferase [Kamptonema sp.]|nr:DNA N-6-adenine-methyltransferase [Kamptonema sp.]
MKSTTTKRRGSNAVSANSKSKKSTSSASISKSANNNRGDATAEHNGDSSSNGHSLLASKRSAELLESGGSDSADNGALVSGEGTELEIWEGKIEWSEEEIKEINRLKSASECVFEVGDRIKEDLNNPDWGKSLQYLVRYGVVLKTEISRKRDPGEPKSVEIRWDDGTEGEAQIRHLKKAPDPKNFSNLEAFKVAWTDWEWEHTDETSAEEIWNQSNNGNGSTCAAASEQDSPTPGLNCGEKNPAISANKINTVETFSDSDTHTDKSLEMSETDSIVTPTLSQQAPLASHSQLMETDWEQPTSETVSPQSLTQSENCNPDSQLSKMCQDSSTVLSDQEAIASTSLESLKIFPKAGTFANGNLSAADTLPPLGIGEESLLLRSPGALSGSDGVRPPGKNRLENQLEKLGLLQAGEVCNPEFLEAGYQLPQGYSNPAETRTALDLRQLQAQDYRSALSPVTEQTAIAVQPSEMLSIGELPLWDSSELNTLQALSEELNLGALNKDELLAKALGQHQAITSIEREEFNLALIKLYRVRLAGLCLQEFKRRCKHGEFEGSLESVKLKPRTAQNYMAIAKNWELIESKAQQISLLEQGQTLGLNWALEAVRESKRSLKSAAAPSDPDCWRTPDTVEQPILFLVKTALGGVITLDPAADDAKSVPALKHFTKEDDGLSQDWEGYVFLNPPFSDPLPWVKKLCFMRGRGDVKGAIALLKAGCINNQGTGELISKYASAICNWRGRIAFLNEDGEPVKGADFDCVLVYFGREPQKFSEVFQPWGTVSLIGNSQLPIANNQQLTANSQQLTNVKQELKIGDWVRVKRGQFEGEIGLIASFENHFFKIHLTTAAPLLTIDDIEFVRRDEPSPASFISVKEEQRAIARELGLKNGKASVLPDVRDSDRAASEAHDPHTVTALIDNNWCKETAIGVISNAKVFEADQATTITHSLINTDFETKTKLLVQRLTDEEIKSLMAICDDELDRRCKA